MPYGSNFVTILCFSKLALIYGEVQRSYFGSCGRPSDRCHTVPVGRLPYMDYARPAERIFKWGEGGMLPREDLKLKSSEMARNGSKTAKSEVNF